MKSTIDSNKLKVVDMTTLEHVHGGWGWPWSGGNQDPTPPPEPPPPVEQPDYCEPSPIPGGGDVCIYPDPIEELENF